MSINRASTWAVGAALCIAGALLSQGAYADEGAADPHIAFTYPAGGKAGTTVQITVHGQNLDGAQTVSISGRHVSARIIADKPKPKPKPDPKAKSKNKGKAKGKAKPSAPDTSATQLKIAVTIDKDATPGQRDLHVITHDGVSNRYRFFVDQLREVREAEPNSKPDNPQALGPLPAVANGQIFGGDKDVFRFRAAAGQTLVFQAQARAILPYLADAVPGWFQANLTLYDAGGKPIAYVDDFRHHPDPVLIHTFKAGGEYLIEITDALSRGRNDFVYRLRVGELPFITHVTPLGVPAGQTTRLRVSGANLPIKTLDFTPDAEPGRLDSVRVTAANGIVSNALPLHVGGIPEQREREPNNLNREPEVVKLPVIVNGTIGSPNDADCFAFDARKGQKIVIDALARRLDSPLDAVVEVFDARGKYLTKNDDHVDPAFPLITHHADSQLIHSVPRDGRYVVRIRDTQSASGDAYQYRLVISEPKPDFELRLMPINRSIAPGGTAVLSAEVIRKHGFDGPVRLYLSGLPDGFASRGAAVPAKEKVVRFTITAPPELTDKLLAPKLSGAATIDGKSVVREARPAQEVMQAFIYKHRPCMEQLLMAVVPPKHFTLSLVEPDEKVVEVPRGGEAKVSIKVHRLADGKRNIRVVALEPPKGLYVRPGPIPVDKDMGTVTIRSTKFPVGYTYNLILVGEMRIGKQTITAPAPAITIQIVEPKPA